MQKPPFKPQRVMWSKKFTYDYWMESLGVPIHKGFYIEDLRNLALGWWEERQCMTAFIQLVGQEGVSSTRITEIPAGENTRPFTFALDEVIYVVSGRGLASIWYGDSSARKTFEWGQHSMFLIPHGCHRQFSNMQGDKPVRLLQYSFLPMAMSAITDPDFFFNNPYPVSDAMAGQEDLYSEAKMFRNEGDTGYAAGRAYWYGNFFPDLKAWDKLETLTRRGAGGKSLMMQFPDSEVSAHMSVFQPQTYKKAHRHGPGRAIIIPDGEGYSIMWEEGKEKIVVPWHECSMVTPPGRWFHQHFNTGATPARYVALHPPMQFHGHAEKVEDRAKDQIEYPDEDPFIRKKFEEELAKRGVASVMPAEAYTNRNYAWSEQMGKK